MSLYTPYAIRFHNSTMTTATLLSAIRSQSIAVNNSITADTDAGSPYPQHVANAAQKPSAQFVSTDVAGALDLVGTEGWPISATNVRPGLDLFQLLIDATTGRPAAGSVHRRLNIQRGIVVPQSLTVDHQADAQLSMQAFAIADPADTATIGVAPLTPFASQAAPTGLAGGSRHTLGPTSIGGVTLACNLRVEINFGVTVTTEGCSSDIHDAGLLIATSNPTIRISGKNMAKFIAADIPLAGKGATHANTSIVLRKRSQTAAGFVANATAEHILITAAGMACWEQVHSATGNGRVEDVLMITCRHDGTNTPIVIDTTHAIP